MNEFLISPIARQKNGFQGVFISADSEERLLLLESLAVKIYETDTTKILRSLAHGIDSCASYEGMSTILLFNFYYRLL